MGWPSPCYGRLIGGGAPTGAGRLSLVGWVAVFVNVLSLQFLCVEYHIYTCRHSVVLVLNLNLPFLPRFFFPSLGRL